MMFIPVLLWLFISQFLAAMEDPLVREEAQREQSSHQRILFCMLVSSSKLFFTTKTKLKKKTPPFSCPVYFRSTTKHKDVR